MIKPILLKDATRDQLERQLNQVARAEKAEYIEQLHSSGALDDPLFIDEYAEIYPKKWIKENGFDAYNRPVYKEGYVREDQQVAFVIAIGESDDLQTAQDRIMVLLPLLKTKSFGIMEYTCSENGSYRLHYHEHNGTWELACTRFYHTTTVYVCKDLDVMLAYIQKNHCAMEY